MLDPTYDLDTSLLTGVAPPAYDFSGGSGDPTMSTTFGDRFGTNAFTPEMIAMLLQPQFADVSPPAPVPFTI